MSKYTKGKLLVTHPESQKCTHAPVELMDENGYEIAWVICQCTRGAKENIDTIDMEDANGNRLVSCWNACLNFQNPEQDISIIKDALSNVKQYFDTYGLPYPIRKQVNEALKIIDGIKDGANE